MTPVIIIYEHASGATLRHSHGADGTDYTLCGLSTDGDLGSHEESADVAYSISTINCPQCITIIDHCKAIKSRDLVRKT